MCSILGALIVLTGGKGGDALPAGSFPIIRSAIFSAAGRLMAPTMATIAL